MGGVLSYGFEERSLRVVGVEVFVDLGDASALKSKYEDVVIGIGLARAGRGAQRQLHEYVLALSGDGFDVEVHGSAHVVEPDPRLHQLENRCQPLVASTDWGTLRGDPTHIVAEEPCDLRVAPLHHLEVALDDLTMSGGGRSCQAAPPGLAGGSGVGDWRAVPVQFYDSLPHPIERFKSLCELRCFISAWLVACSS